MVIKAYIFEGINSGQMYYSRRRRPELKSKRTEKRLFRDVNPERVLILTKF